MVGRALALALLCCAGPLAAQHEHAVGAPLVTKARDAMRAKPALSIGAAVSPAGQLWIVGLDHERRLFVQTGGGAGQRWSEPRLLDIGSDTVAADGENRPKIAFGPDNRAVISYTQPLAKPYTGEIRMLRSEDGGTSFSPPFSAHHSWAKRRGRCSASRLGRWTRPWRCSSSQVAASRPGSRSMSTGCFLPVRYSCICQ